MEVDILNDLLTRTVSNLFSNKNRHMSYLSEDDGEKQEIFPQQDIVMNNQKQKPNMTHNLNHLNNNLNNQNDQPKKNLIEKIINNNIQKNPKQTPNNLNQENCSPKIWCLTVGKKKYEESLERLQINEKIIASKTHLNDMNLEQLTREKARVKQELKKYDEDFFQVFKSKPTKENKEIMKPLYYYYQKLKIAISKKSNNNSDMNSTTETIVRNDMNNNNHNIHGSNVTNNQSVYPNTVSDSESMLTQDTFSNTNTNTITNSDLVSNTSESSRQSKISQNGNVYLNNMNNKGNNNMNYNIFHRKANSGGGPSNNPQIKVEEFNLNNRNNQKRSLSKEEINALEQEYFSIKKEQLNLTQMLRNYQNEFQKTNNRKVKWTKDIRPVEKEYNKYKANKERIKEIKELFGHIENNNNNK